MERGPKGYEAGQPIDTDDAMNDTPRNAVDDFVDRMQKRVADGTYTQEEADALIEKAKARHEEKEEAIANEAAYNAWANMTPDEASQRSDDFAKNFAGESEEGQNRNGDFTMFPRQAGESNEEYGARLRRMHEATKQYQEENPLPEDPAEKTAMDSYREMVEKRVENGDLKREEADAMIAKREAQYGEMQEAKAEEARNEEAFLNFDDAQEKAKMEMAERIRKEVPEALEFLEKHPELKTEMAAAVKKLEELEAIAKIEGDAKSAIDAELAHRNETFMKAVEAFNAAARANEEARKKMDEFEKKGTGTDAEYQVILDEIHKTEDDMKAADANKKNAESEYNAAEAAIREDAEKRAGDLRDRMNERDKYVAEERDYYNEHFMEAQAGYQIAKNANEAARAKMKDLEAKGASDEELQACEDEIHATEKAMADAKAKMDEFKQDQVEAADVMEEWVDRGLGKKPAAEGAGAEAGAAEGAATEDGAGEDAGKGGEADGEKEEFEKFFNDYFNDPDFRAIYTRNGVFDEESCRIAIKNMYDAKKANEAKEAGAAEGAAAETGAAAEGEDGEYEYTDEDFEGLDDDLENDEQKGLFAKIKGFFNRNKRVKNGSKKEVKNWRKKALAGVLAFMLGAQIANFLGNSGIFNKNKTDVDTGSEVETEAASTDNNDEKTPTLDEIAEDLSLEVDLNEEKGEELKDMIHGKVEGVETDLSVSAGEWSGVDAYFDENKTSSYAIGSPVYDREHMSEMTRFEISKAGFEGIAERLDNPGVLAQWTALFAGGDLVYHDDNGNDIKGINSREDLNQLLKMLQEDDEARQYFADFCKQEYANLGENYEVRSRTIEMGETYTSTYILNMAPEGEQPRMIYFIDWECTADKQKNELYFVDENGENVMDKNEIGSIKYNVMKSLGLISENATDEEAIATMKKYEFRGMLLDCGGGQPDLRLIIPDTGTEKTGDETGTGKETEETGKETEETGKETEETGTEKETEETGTEKETEETGTEKETAETGTEKETEETGTEKETAETGTEKETAETGTEKETAETGTEKETIETGTEKETAETGTEKETDETGDGKTDILPGDEDDGWDVIDQPTQDETGPTSEADRTPVDEGGNGYVNDETPGSSSNLHEVNGGDQGGGNTDADGGGSTNPDTEATYDGSETGGWQGENASEEPGTQTVDEPNTPEEVNAINDSEANPDSAGEDQAPGEGRDAAMDRLG